MAWTSRLIEAFVAIVLGNAYAVAAASVPDALPAPSAISSHDTSIDGHHLHFVIKEGLGKTPILFIHGSPGDWQAWRFYLDSPQLAHFGTRIAVDRPGFGLSEPSRVMPELRQQAQLLAQLLPKNQQSIIVGHSLGAPIALWLGIDHPELVCAVVSVAGSLSAEREAPRWYNTLANWRIVKTFMSQDMRDSNQEMMVLSQQLQLLAAALPQSKKPITLIQGQDDALVEPQTVDDMAKLLPASLLHINRVANQGHFVIWKKPDVLINTLRTMNCP